MIVSLPSRRKCDLIARSDRGATSNREGVIPIAILKKTQQQDTPGQLASELAAAKHDYQAKRYDVIDRGVERSQALAALIAEAQEEQAGVESVIADAKQA